MAKMYRVYTIIQRPKQDDYWLNIGVAFPHEDGKGFNVMLQALPIHGDGKMVLREHEAKDHADEETGQDAGSKPANGRNKDRGEILTVSKLADAPKSLGPREKWGSLFFETFFELCA